jgi:molecular chaperone DnaK
MTKPIGIDLGTTMSAMAQVDETGQPRMIPNNKGKTLTPSAILIRGDERTVGEPARNSALARPDNVVMFVKREMDNPDPEFRFEADGKTFTPEDLSALILLKLKQDAEKALGEDVPSAVITVPAYFADLERNRTRMAGKIAGLDVIDIINEPTAAAIAYGLSRDRRDRKILVYDLGGGTFDITIMAVEGGDLRVLTSNGDRHLGGVDFDEALATYFAEKFEAKWAVRPLDDPRSYQDFRDKAENAKIDLSDTSEVPVSLTADGKVLDLDVTRSDFERLIAHYIDRTKSLTEQAIRDAGLSAGQIDTVLLVGGSIRIPAVRQMVRDLVNKEPETGINPDEVVAIGAAVYAANERGVAVRDTAGRVLPPATVRNVTAHSLGIKVQDRMGGPDRNAKLIRKDSLIPASGSDVFSTVEDNQTAVRITILQGEHDDPAECVLVGDGAMLTGIPPQPAGAPQITVTLEYDKSGIVHVHARDNASGQEVRADIEYKALVSGAAVQEAIARIEQAKVQ